MGRRTGVHDRGPGLVRRGGYRCLQSHRATAGWEPPRAPALWQRG
ncbi:carbohydrate-binding protein [Actinomadura keratinilytica]